MFERDGCGATIGGVFDGVAFFAETAEEEVGDAGFIFDDEDAAAHGRISEGVRSPMEGTHMAFSLLLILGGRSGGGTSGDKIGFMFGNFPRGIFRGKERK